MDKALLAEMLKELSPAELRAIRYDVAGGHKCTNSSSLITCCDVSRCEACHIPHLKQVHDDAKLYAFQKFYRTGTMTWPGYIPAKAAKKKQTKVTTRTRTKSVPTKLDPITAANQVSDSDLDKVLAILEAKLRR
jgi:hypothetical protein